MDQLEKSLAYSISILDDADLQNEFKAFRAAFQRLKVRFRNNHFIAELKQLVSLTVRMRREFPSMLFQSYHDQIRVLSKKQQKRAVYALHKLVGEMILFLDKAIDTTLQKYAYSQRHFKVGHHSHHLILIRTCIARLRVCFKALLVHTTDLLLEVIPHSRVDLRKDKGIDFISYEEARNILIKHDCKPRLEPTTSQIDDADVEVIGDIVDRASFRRSKTTRS